MPSEWYLLGKPLFNSGFEDDEFWDYANDGFEDTLNSFLGRDVEIYEKSLDVPPVETRAIIENVTGDIFNNSTQRQILTRIGTLRSGQYVKTDGQFWMVSTLPDNNRMYEKAMMWQCKYSLFFVSPITGKVVEYPVYAINSTQYGSGQTHRSFMDIGTAQHLVYVPYNQETIMLDCGTRFLIDKNKEHPTAYRITQVDTGSYSCGENDGLLQWTLAECQSDAKTDNFELMVADYYGKSELSKPDPLPEGYQIMLTPGYEGGEVIFGEEIAIQVDFYENGEKIPSLPFTAEITDGVEYGTIQATTGNDVTVRALDNRDYIGQEITVKVRSDSINTEESIVLRVKGWY